MMESRLMENEKQALLPSAIEPPSHLRPRKRSTHTIKGLLIGVLLFGWWAYYAIPDFLDLGRPNYSRPRPAYEDFVDFEDIIPSEKLEWHPCYPAPFQCARLTVPMDYHRPLNASKDNPKVHIALLLVPGNHTGAEKHSKSPLLLNPGGPGGSGTSFALGLGSQIAHLVGEEQDVIGFDPRGIGATTPRADCFSYGDEDLGDVDYQRGNLHRIMWSLAGRDIGNVNSSADSLYKLDVRARTVAKLCREKDSLDGRDSIMRYVHTPSVARDMISIIDAWDEWVESSMMDTIAEPSQDEFLHEERPSDDDESQVPDTKGKLVYWGFSYGTLLGATFASMFPDRVGRVVLDGVVDADLYVSPLWSDSIRDADKIFNSFAKYCHEASTDCLLYRAGDTVEDLHKRFVGVLESLKTDPITIIESQTKSPIVVSYSDIRLLIFVILYAPTMAFPSVALLANLIYEGQREAVGQSLGASAILFDLDPICTPSYPSRFYGSEAQAAIMCSDKRYPLNETLPELQARFETMAKSSSWADVWMTLMLGCEGWKIEAVDPPMRWDDHPAHKLKPIKTSHPLLFVSNTADPVTPLKAGVKMAKKFVDAGLIEQHSEGHCSLAAVSLCTINKIRTYFTTGEVPPPPMENEKDWSRGKWVQCDADEWPFHPYNAADYISTQGAEAKVDSRRLTAMKEMQAAFDKMRVWGQHGSMGDGISNLKLGLERLERDQKS